MPIWDKAKIILAESGKVFAVKDAFALINEVSSTGKWATRVTFVYTHNEHSVYYVKDRNFDIVEKYSF